MTTDLKVPMGGMDNNLDPWKHFKPKYHVDKDAYVLYDRMAEVSGNRLPYDFDTIEEAREHDRLIFTTLAGDYHFEGTTYEVKIPLANYSKHNIVTSVKANDNSSGPMVGINDNSTMVTVNGNIRLATSNDTISEATNTTDNNISKVTVNDNISVASFNNSHEDITAQIYQPSTLQENPSIWVYFHGGGHIMGCSETYKTALQMIADRSKCIVVSVDYRLLPHADKCAPFNDCIAATRWVARNKVRIGGKKSSKLGIGGDSSGGHITACVAVEVTDLVDFQILIYPFTDPTRTLPSRIEFADDPLLPKKMLDWSFDLTVAQMPNFLTDPKLNPMIQDVDSNRSPPALFIVAELDPFRDDGIEYARKLRVAGVDVNVVTLYGIPHFFFNIPGVFPKTCDKVYSEIASFINSM